MALTTSAAASVSTSMELPLISSGRTSPAVTETLPLYLLTRRLNLLASGLRQPGALERGQRAGAHPPQQPGVGRPDQGVGASVAVGLGLPPRLPGRERRVVQFRAIERVVVDVHDDGVAVLDERDRPAQRRLG